MKFRIILFFLIFLNIPIIYSIVQTVPEFSLVTCNVLYQQWYEMNADKNHLMPLKDRVKAFQDTFKNPIFQNVDIFCFQEWPYTAPKSQDYNYQFFKALENGLGGSKKFVADYVALKPKETIEKDSILMVINKQKFTIIDSGTQQFEEKNKSQMRYKRFAYAILQDKPSKKIIGIINAHIPFKNHGVHFNSVKKVIQHYENKYPIFGWVLCGDFNYNSWDAQNATIDLNIYAKLKAMVGNLFKQPVSSNVEQVIQPKPTSISANYQFNDYIFYTINLGQPNFSIYPEQSTKLIRHVKFDNNWFNDYFSDHAIIRADFKDLHEICPVEVTKSKKPTPEMNKLHKAFNTLTDELQFLEYSVTHMHK